MIRLMKAPQLLRVDVALLYLQKPVVPLYQQVAQGKICHCYDLCRYPSVNRFGPEETLHWRWRECPERHKGIQDARNGFEKDTKQTEMVCRLSFFLNSDVTVGCNQVAVAFQHYHVHCDTGHYNSCLVPRYPRESCP